MTSAEFVKSSDIFCDTRHCDPVRDDEPLYLDGNHLSYAGGALLAPRIFRAIEAN